MRTVRCIYWSRYDQDSSYKWHSIKGYSSFGIATRGIWISGKYSHDKERKAIKPVLKLIRKLRFPEMTFNTTKVSFEEFEAWLLSGANWTKFEVPSYTKRERIFHRIGKCSWNN